MGIWWGGGDTAPRTSVSQHPQAVGRPCLLSYPLYRWVYPQESICRGNAGVAFVQAKPELKSRLKSQGICGHKVADFQLRAVWGSLLSASHSFSQTAGTAWGLGRVEGEKWKHKTEDVSSPSLLAKLGTRTPFSGFQGLIWPLFCQVLLDRVVCHVRALVVLPTKELAQQVCGSSPSLSRAGLRDRLVQPVLWLFCGAGWRPASGSDAAHGEYLLQLILWPLTKLISLQVSKVFNVYTDGTGLKVVLITGQKSFAKEQEMLVQKK